MGLSPSRLAVTVFISLMSIPISDNSKNCRRVDIHTSSSNCGILVLVSVSMLSSIPATRCAHCNCALIDFPKALFVRRCRTRKSAFAAPCSMKMSISPNPPRSLGPYTNRFGMFLLYPIDANTDLVMLLLILSASFLLSVPAGALYSILGCIIVKYNMFASSDVIFMDLARLAKSSLLAVNLFVSSL
jgi:hypothetical protein